MDELIHHCIHEISFDGELGCKVSRLKDFIIDFYSRSEESQNVDDTFCAFVWSAVVQQPVVRIGVVPPGITSPVYIAPQRSAQKKGKGIGGEQEDARQVSLHVIPDAAVQPLEALVRQYGDNLRIAVDPENVFVAITGSHARPAKLTPMVYTALQLIARGREQGLTAVDLSSSTGYDAKTCHYLIDKLLELNLIVKRKQSGVGGNLCIHKYYFERSAEWQKVLAEEAEAEAIDVLKTELEEDPNVADDHDVQGQLRTDLGFGPIDSKHLSSLPLVRARVVKLLKHSPHYMHSTHNLLVTLGFAHPMKTERRFFATRLREMMAEKFIEKIQVPNPKRKNGIVTCIRLLSPGEVSDDVHAPDVEVQQEEPEQDERVNLMANFTVHRQIIDVIHNAGPAGITLSELSIALRNFDRRIIELILSRLERSPPPAHLSDLAITATQETYGRERRFRYYTLVNYRVAAQKEAHPNYGDIDISQAGDFLPVPTESFYKTVTELDEFVDHFKMSEEDIVSAKAKARAAPKSKSVMKGKEPKEKLPPKPKIYKNPMLPDGTVKRGRPRKEWGTQRGQKRKRDEDNADEGESREEPAVPTAGVTADAAEPPPKKRRGRPPKKRPENASPAPAPNEMGTGGTGDLVQSQGQAVGHGNSLQDTALTSPMQPSDEPSQPLASNTLGATSDSAEQDASAELSVQSPIEGPSTSTSAQLQDPPNFQAAQDAAMQILQSICASRDEAVTSEVPIDPALIHSTPRPIDTVPEGASHQMASTSAMSALSSAIDVELEHKAATDRESTQRANSESISSRPSKRARGKGILNVTQARREKEIMRIIEEAGGIVNTSSKDFYDAHAALIETLSKEGEPVSVVPGSRIDKRTVDTTMRALEDRGQLKIISTIVSNEAGLSRTVRVAYLPSTSPEALQAFLDDIGRNLRSFLPAAPVKTLDQAVAYGGLKQKQQVSAAAVLSASPLEVKKDHDTAEKIFQGDDESIRRALLSEKNTVTQLYGGILGRTARARELHLMTVDLFEKGGQSPCVVSAEQRILDVSYYSTDIPVAAYCAIVACLFPNEELYNILNDPETRRTPLSMVPPSVLNTLEPGKSRSNARIQDLLEILQALGLVTPLQPSKFHTPLINITASGEHPTAYDLAPSIGLPPQYWRFNTIAPVHLWARSAQSPPIWKEFPVHSKHEAMEFWRNLERASTDQLFAMSLADVSGETIDPMSIPDKVIRGLRRPRDWSTEYTLSWYQIEYLRTFIDKSTGDTPLQNEETGQARLARISYVVCAPERIVRQFYARERERYSREKDKLKKRRTAEERAKQRAEDKAELARKAAEAREQRERDWDELVRRVHPEPLQGSAALRVRRLRTQFLQAPTVDVNKWEAEVRKALEEVRVTAKKIVSVSRPSLGGQLPIPTPPPAIPNAAALQRSVDELIDLLRSAPARPEKEKGKKPKKGERRAFDEPKERRNRFQWNPEYDELARDASVIIKSRCRSKRLEWTALDQIFEPAVAKNSVRQRIVRLVKDTPGGEAYAKRLEDKWHDLWIRHRGTDALLDEDPDSPSNFDLVAHIKFLRTHIDKNALRVGIVEVDDGMCTSLPATVEELEQNLSVLEKEVTSPSFDFMWTDPSDDSRDKRLMRTAFINRGTDIPLQRSYPDERLYIADAGLKMVLGTPQESYDAEVAAALLKSVGEEFVQTATRLMLERNVLSKMVRDIHKPKPGRTLKISDANTSALGGSFHLDVLQDAIAQEDELLAEQDENERREWSLLATDGDAAALIELVSEGKLDFRFDTSHAQSVRPVIDWNSKKTDDDDIENVIYVRCTKDTRPLPNAVVHSAEPVAVESGESMLDETAQVTNDTMHGITIGGQPACCRRSCAALVDCVTCLAEETEKVLQSFGEPEAEVTRHVLETLHEASAKGVTRERLKDELEGIPPSMVNTVIDRLTSTTIPLAFWAGYSRIVLVSSEYLEAWAIPIPQPEGDLTRVFPRRWLDIYGCQLSSILEAAHRAVINVILFKPGISQAEVRWQLRTIYDRQEVNDVLSDLLVEGLIKRTVDENKQLLGTGPPDDAEEYGVFWTADDQKHWYTVQ